MGWCRSERGTAAELACMHTHMHGDPWTVCSARVSPTHSQDLEAQLATHPPDSTAAGTTKQPLYCRGGGGAPKTTQHPLSPQHTASLVIL